MKKTWYEIVVITKDGKKTLEGKNGEYTNFSVVAKVKSPGLAYLTAEFMKSIYKPEKNFTIRIS